MPSPFTRLVHNNLHASTEIHTHPHDKATQTNYHPSQIKFNPLLRIKNQQNLLKPSLLFLFVCEQPPITCGNVTYPNSIISQPLLISLALLLIACLYVAMA